MVRLLDSARRGRGLGRGDEAPSDRDADIGAGGTGSIRDAILGQIYLHVSTVAMTAQDRTVRFIETGGSLYTGGPGATRLPLPAGILTALMPARYRRKCR